MRYPHSPYRRLARPKYDPWYQQPITPLLIIGAALAATVLLTIYNL